MVHGRELRYATEFTLLAQHLVLVKSRLFYPVTINAKTLGNFQQGKEGAAYMLRSFQILFMRAYGITIFKSQLGVCATGSRQQRDGEYRPNRTAAPSCLIVINFCFLDDLVFLLVLLANRNNPQTRPFIVNKF
jgi:hypothetical protein